jgi:hypothetical protein
MESRGYICIMSISAMMLGACKKPYAPVMVKTDSNILVVEGVINTGNDSTVIKLSRTVNLSGKNTAKPEARAQVTIEGDQQFSYTLTETDSGRYVSAPLNLDNTHKYRLSIQTTNGNTYVSDYVASRVTPPIDTFNYVVNNTGVNFYASAHDPANKTKYYRWEYAETYIYESALNTQYEFDNSYPQTSDKFRLLTPENQIHICYVTTPSSTIVLNSNAAISQDVIVNNPITFVSSASEKFYHRYSILLKQYALTQGAYQFWANLKKNTEQIGSIFDAQPSEIKGNIHCTSKPAELVIGYISAGTVSQKRLFIDNRDLPLWPVPAPEGCTTQGLSWADGATPSELISKTWIPITQPNSVYNPAHKSLDYSVQVGYYDCVDCRYHLHGINKKPAFWK